MYPAFPDSKIELKEPNQLIQNKIMKKIIIEEIIHPVTMGFLFLLIKSYPKRPLSLALLLVSLFYFYSYNIKQRVVKSVCLYFLVLINSKGKSIFLKEIEEKGFGPILEGKLA